jgi:hypothetical protein
LDSNGAMLNGRNIDSRAASAASNVNPNQPQQSGAQSQQSQQAASAQRKLEANNGADSADRHDDAPDDYYITDLYYQLSQVITAKPTDIEPLRIGI